MPDDPKSSSNPQTEQLTSTSTSPTPQGTLVPPADTTQVTGTVAVASPGPKIGRGEKKKSGRKPAVRKTGFRNGSPA